MVTALDEMRTQFDNFFRWARAVQAWRQVNVRTRLRAAPRQNYPTTLTTDSFESNVTSCYNLRGQKSEVRGQLSLTSDVW